MTKKQLLEKSYPNGHKVSLMSYELSPGDLYYVVRTPGTGYDFEDGDEYETEADARQAYADQVKKWADEPNWEAQERYDEAHGTINGYAPWQLSREY